MVGEGLGVRRGEEGVRGGIDGGKMDTRMCEHKSFDTRQSTQSN